VVVGLELEQPALAHGVLVHQRGLLRQLLVHLALMCNLWGGGGVGGQ
jgi:hypothetical protein